MLCIKNYVIILSSFKRSILLFMVIGAIYWFSEHCIVWEALHCSLKTVTNNVTRESDILIKKFPKPIKHLLDISAFYCVVKHLGRSRGFYTVYNIDDATILLCVSHDSKKIWNSRSRMSRHSQLLEPRWGFSSDDDDDDQHHRYYDHVDDVNDDDDFDSIFFFFL